jgi:peroxin-5
LLITQFTNDEDDLFETLNDSLNRDDVGQTPLEDQLNLDPGLVRPDLQGFLEADDGVPSQRGYEYGMSDALNVSRRSSRCYIAHTGLSR